MKIKLVAAAALVASFAVPAFAANQFYVVQDVKTKNAPSSTRTDRVVDDRCEPGRRSLQD